METISNSILDFVIRALDEAGVLAVSLGSSQNIGPGRRGLYTYHGGARSRGSKYTPHQGAREMKRRAHQQRIIAARQAWRDYESELIRARNWNITSQELRAEKRTYLANAVANAA